MTSADFCLISKVTKTERMMEIDAPGVTHAAEPVPPGAEAGVDDAAEWADDEGADDAWTVRTGLNNTE